MRSPSSEGRPGEPAEAIHEARKDMKKVRSAIRLVRDHLGDDLWRRENDHYRNVERMLSGFRTRRSWWNHSIRSGSASGLARGFAALGSSRTRC